jgi:hypothetical protein
MIQSANKKQGQPSREQSREGFSYEKITTTLSGGRDYYGLPAGQFYLSDFSKAKTVLRYFAISKSCYATVSSLGLTANFSFFIIQHKGYRIRTAAVSTI